MTAQLLDQEAGAREITPGMDDVQSSWMSVRAPSSWIAFDAFGTSCGFASAVSASITEGSLGWGSALRTFQPFLFHVSCPPTWPDEMLAQTHHVATTAETLHTVHLSTGLTWDQISRLFGVSRRAVHLWVAGGRMSAAKDELLSEIMRIITSLGERSPDQIRRELFRARPNGYPSIYDELRSRHGSTESDINRSVDVI